MASRPTGRGQLLESRQRSLQRGSVTLPSLSTHCGHLYSASVSRRLHTQRELHLCWVLFCFVLFFLRHSQLPASMYPAQQQAGQPSSLNISSVSGFSMYVCSHLTGEVHLGSFRCP